MFEKVSYKLKNKIIKLGLDKAFKKSYSVLIKNPNITYDKYLISLVGGKMVSKFKDKELFKGYYEIFDKSLSRQEYINQCYSLTLQYLNN